MEGSLTAATLPDSELHILLQFPCSLLYLLFLPLPHLHIHDSPTYCWSLPAVFYTYASLLPCQVPSHSPHPILPCLVPVTAFLLLQVSDLLELPAHGAGAVTIYHMIACLGRGGPHHACLSPPLPAYLLLEWNACTFCTCLSWVVELPHRWGSEPPVGTALACPCLPHPTPRAASTWVVEHTVRHTFSCYPCYHLYSSAYHPSASYMSGGGYTAGVCSPIPPACSASTCSACALCFSCCLPLSFWNFT